MWTLRAYKWIGCTAEERGKKRKDDKETGGRIEEAEMGTGSTGERGGRRDGWRGAGRRDGRRRGGRGEEKGERVDGVKEGEWAGEERRGRRRRAEEMRDEKQA